MSQVIVTNDTLKKQREKSAEQEHRIDRESQFQHWRKSDITGKDLVASAIGFAVVPIVALWAFLTGLIAGMLTICRFAFKALGAIVGGKKRLA